MFALSPRALVLVTMMLGIVTASGAPARAEKQDARKHYDQATAAFGLGRYAEAAAEYEKAFVLRPEPALLYNCAQSYRLAGNKARALELYRNYLRLFGEAPNADDARKHVNDLELEIAAERAVSPRADTSGQSQAPTPVAAAPPAAGSLSAARPPATSGGVSPAQGALSSGSPESATPPAPGIVAPLSSPPPVYVAAQDGATAGVASDGGQTPLLRRPWFWVAVGAAVVGGTVAVLLATRGEKDPVATLGTVVGN